MNYLLKAKVQFNAHVNKRMPARNIYTLAPHITFKVSRGGAIITYYKGNAILNNAPRSYTTIPARAIGFNPSKKDVPINIEKIGARDNGAILYALAARAAFMTMRAAFTAKNGAIVKAAESAADKSAALERAADKGGSAQYDVRCYYSNKYWYYSTRTLKSEIFNSLANAAAVGLINTGTMRGALNAASNENYHTFGKATKTYKALTEMVDCILDRTTHYKNESRSRSILIDAAAALAANGVDPKLRRVYALTVCGYLTSEIASLVYGAKVNADNTRYWCDRINNDRRAANKLISAATKGNVNINAVRARHTPKEADYKAAAAFTKKVRAASADKERAAGMIECISHKSKSDASDRAAAYKAAAALQCEYFNLISGATYKTLNTRHNVKTKK